MAFREIAAALVARLAALARAVPVKVVGWVDTRPFAFKLPRKLGLAARIRVEPFELLPPPRHKADARGSGVPARSARIVPFRASFILRLPPVTGAAVLAGSAPGLSP